MKSYKIVYIYSKKQIETINEKEDGNRIVYANPNFFKQIETSVDKVYTDVERIAELYRRAHVPVEPITPVTPVEPVEPATPPVTKQEATVTDVELKDIKKTISAVKASNDKHNELHEWKTANLAKQREIALGLASEEETSFLKTANKADVMSFLESKLGE